MNPENVIVPGFGVVHEMMVVEPDATVSEIADGFDGFPMMLR